MESLARFEKREDHLLCIAAHFDYNIENIEAFTQRVLTACRFAERNRVLVDFTAIREETPETLKAISGFVIKEQLKAFQKEQGSVPRIAVFGTAPHIIKSNKPTHEILQRAGMPVAVFDNEPEARKWLFDEDAC